VAGASTASIARVEQAALQLLWHGMAALLPQAASKYVWYSTPCFSTSVVSVWSAPEMSVVRADTPPARPL
jgi:cytochrome c oxidase assembly factor CtaG